MLLSSNYNSEHNTKQDLFIFFTNLVEKHQQNQKFANRTRLSATITDIHIVKTHAN